MKAFRPIFKMTVLWLVPFVLLVRYPYLSAEFQLVSYEDLWVYGLSLLILVSVLFYVFSIYRRKFLYEYMFYFIILIVGYILTIPFRYQHVFSKFTFFNKKQISHILSVEVLFFWICIGCVCLLCILLKGFKDIFLLLKRKE